MKIQKMHSNYLLGELPQNPSLNANQQERVSGLVADMQIGKRNKPSVEGRVLNWTFEELDRRLEAKITKVVANAIDDVIRKRPKSHPWIARIVHWVESKFQ